MKFSQGVGQSRQRNPSSNAVQRQPAASSQREKRTSQSSIANVAKQPKITSSYIIMISLEVSHTHFLMYSFLSALNVELFQVDRDKIEEPIANLGGAMAATYEPDSKELPRATHLIVEDLKKTEKMLCAIAAGLWVLRASFLEASFKNGAFVNVSYRINIRIHLQNYVIIT